MDIPVSNPASGTSCVCHVKQLLFFASVFYFYPAVVVGILANWASEASPTLGCSIEISRDILEKWFPLRGELQLLFRPC